MSLQDSNRPLRVFDKVLQGGLGAGNIGLIISRHGTGKVAVMTSIAIDHALNGVNTLHAVMGKSIDEVRAYDDEVLHAMMEAYAIEDRGSIATQVERHKQIYTYGSGVATTERLRGTLEFLTEHAQFKPGLIELQGWADLHEVSVEEIADLKALAKEYEAEIWFTAHTTREHDVARSIPDFIKPFEQHFSVVVGLEPENDHVNLRFLKIHDSAPSASDAANLEFDPKTFLIRDH